MVVRYKAESKCECRWFYKETLITESSMMKVVHEKKESFYECRLQITVNFNIKLGSVYFKALTPWPRGRKYNVGQLTLVAAWLQSLKIPENP